MSGTSARTLVVDGVARTYVLHAGGAKAGRALVLMLHGWGGNGVEIEHRTRGGFDRIADREGAVVAYPDALGDKPRWNDGWPASPGDPPPDDLRFLEVLIDALVAELGVDRGRVFAAGFSNGASMVYRLACERPELVAAAAPVAGGMSPAVASACPGGRPVSIIAMHGTADPMVPFDSAVRNDLATWVRRDRCPTMPRSAPLPDVDPNDGTTTRVDTYEPCADGSAVTFYEIAGGGHAWPGGESKWGRGPVPRDFDAADVIWDFFQRHARR